MALKPVGPIKYNGRTCMEDGCSRAIYYGHNKYWCKDHYANWRYELQRPSPPLPPPPSNPTLRKYGLTVDDYSRMLREQKGGCAICKRPPGKRALAVDHDHKCCPTSKSCGKCVRGLLCPACNTSLAIVENYLPESMAYLQKHEEMTRIE